MTLATLQQIRAYVERFGKLVLGPDAIHSSIFPSLQVTGGTFLGEAHETSTSGQIGVHMHLYSA